MKRLLIFLLVFPALATVSFYLVLYLLTGAEVDSFTGPILIYVFATVPGLAFAIADFGISRSRFPATIGTGIVAYTVLVLLLMYDDSAQNIAALAGIGAVPAAICSWLSKAKQSLAVGA